MKKIRMRLAKLFCCAVILLTFSAPAEAWIWSNFNSGTENWTVSGMAIISYSPCGGNPIGYLDVIEGGGDTFEVVAPSKFLGDLSEYNGGSLSFDAKLISADSETYGSGFGKVTILGGGYSVELDLALDPPENKWVTYSASLIASYWDLDEDIWNQILAYVTEIRIILESVVGYETMGFDNFKIYNEDPACACDLNKDGKCNIFDYQIFIQDWGKADCPVSP